MSDWLEVEKREGNKFMQQLVDENIALRAENARLREELEATKCGSPDSRFGECVRRSYAARAAMGESDD